MTTPPWRRPVRQRVMTHIKNTIFLGFNGDRAACEAILNGQMTMSVAQMAYEMGYKAVETMVQALDGETVDEFVDSGSDVVTPDNAQERLDTLKTAAPLKSKNCISHKRRLCDNVHA